MAIISDKLSKILSAVFGKDVRQALHDGLDAINKETESTTSRQYYLDRKYDEQIKNMTLQDPSSAEIVDMRVAANGKTFEKAGDRLNYFDEQLDEIEIEKATKLEVDVERKRINNLTSLEEGSTTGDAELLDGRVGANAKTYDNIGENIRDIAKGNGMLDKSISSTKIDDEFLYDTGIYESAKLLTMSNLINNYNFRKDKEGWLFEYNTTGEISGNEVTINTVPLGRIKSNSIGTYKINSRFYFRFEYKTTGITARGGIVTTSNNNFHPGSIELPNTQNEYATFSSISQNIVDNNNLSFEVLCSSKNNDNDTFSLRNILVLDLKKVFPTTWQTITKDEVEKFIKTYTSSKAFLKQTTDIVNANRFINGDEKNKGKFFVSKSDTDVSITYKYDNSNDIRVTFGKRGGNNIFDLKSMLKIPNDNQIVTSNQSGNSFYVSSTDTFGPYVVRAINNEDGDNIVDGHFTGGNHNYNNDGTTGIYSATGRTSEIKIKVDGVNRESISDYANHIDIYWINYIQGYNTKKADGSGREILKETYHLSFDGNKFYVENFIEALEDIEIKLYYGMQLSYGPWNDKLLYINSTVRSWQDGKGGHYGMGKKCNRIKFKKGNDYAEMFMSYDGIGDKELNDKSYGALTMNYGKAYFVPINIPTIFNKGDIITFNGYYKFYSI